MAATVVPLVQGPVYPSFGDSNGNIFYAGFAVVKNTDVPNVLAAFLSQPNYAGTLLINDAFSTVAAGSDKSEPLSATLTPTKDADVSFPRSSPSNATLVDCSSSVSCTR